MSIFNNEVIIYDKRTVDITCDEYEALVKRNAYQMGYRLMRRRKGRDEYWIVVREPGTLDQINEWFIDAARRKAVR